MRILSFSRKWPKLHLELPMEQRPDFTTIRYYFVLKPDDLVQVYYKQRSRDRERLGVSRIHSIEPVELDPYFKDSGIRLLTNDEAIEDGFESLDDLVNWMMRAYGCDWISRMNKFTLEWVSHDS